MATIEEYLIGITPSQKAEFKQIRRIVHEVVPEAEEVISYGVPTFKYKSRPLLYFGAYKNHMSIYPASDMMIEEIGESLNAFRTSKGTFQFTSDNRIPDAMLKKIVQYRLGSIKKS